MANTEKYKTLWDCIKRYKTRNLDVTCMQKMLDMFEDNDDVQNVWHNWEDAE